MYVRTCLATTLPPMMDLAMMRGNSRKTWLCICIKAFVMTRLHAVFLSSRATQQTTNCKSAGRTSINP